MNPEHLLPALLQEHLWLIFVVQVAVLGTVLLAMLWLSDWLRPRLSAADRHWLWWAALVACLVAPLVRSLLDSGSGLIPKHPAESPASIVPTFADLHSSAKAPTVSRGTYAASAADHAISRRQEPALLSLAPNSPLTRPLLIILCLGSVTLLSRVIVGRVRRARLEGGCRTLDDPGWQQTLRQAATRLGVRRTVRLLRHPACRVPMTWGTWRPVVCMPASAETWPQDRRDAVLLHELAHVRRWDDLLQTTAEWARVLVWFHPLAWIAVRRLRLERELACDDLVLGTGVQPSRYAEHLLDLVRDGGIRPAPEVLAMGSPHRLSARVMAILDPTRVRRANFSMTLAGLLLGALACLAPTPLSVAAPNPAPRPADTRSAILPEPRPTPGLDQLRKAVDEQQRRVDQRATELDSLRKNLVRIEAEGIAATDLPRRGVSPTDERLAPLRTEVQSKLLRVESLFKGLSTMAKEGLNQTLLALFPDDPVARQLGAMLATAEVEADLARETDGEGSAAHVRARKRLELINKRLNARSEGVMAGLELQAEAHRRELEGLDHEIKRAATAARRDAAAWAEYFVEKRDAENDRLLLDILKRKLAQETFDAAVPRGPTPSTAPE